MAPRSVPMERVFWKLSITAILPEAWILAMSPGVSARLTWSGCSLMKAWIHANLASASEWAAAAPSGVRGPGPTAIAIASVPMLPRRSFSSEVCEPWSGVKLTAEELGSKTSVWASIFRTRASIARALASKSASDVGAAARAVVAAPAATTPAAIRVVVTKVGTRQAVPPLLAPPSADTWNTVFNRFDNLINTPVSEAVRQPGVVVPAVDTHPRVVIVAGRADITLCRRKLFRIDVEKVVRSNHPLEPVAPLVTAFEVRNVLRSIDARVERLEREGIGPRVIFIQRHAFAVTDFMQRGQPTSRILPRSPHDDLALR